MDAREVALLTLNACQHQGGWSDQILKKQLAAAGLDVAAIRQDARDLGSRAAAAGQDFFRRWLTGVFTA